MKGPGSKAPSLENSMKPDPNALAYSIRLVPFFDQPAVSGLVSSFPQLVEEAICSRL